MSLNGVDSSNGYLEATTTDGSAVSEIITQDVADGDFTEVKNISADFEFANISTATIADTLTTDELIVDGDKLVIVKNDDSIHEVVASGVGSAISIKSKIHTSNTVPVGYIITSGNVFGSYAAWKAFDQNEISSFVIFTTGDSHHWVAYEFPSNTTITSITMNGYNSGGAAANITQVIVSGWNGISYEELHIENFTADWVNSELRTFSLSSTGNFIKYKLKFTSTDPTYCVSSRIDLKSNEYNMDTTATTAGEVPNRVFRTNESIFFNDSEPNLFSTSMSLTLETLLATKIFADMNISGRTLETKVELSATGNKMTEISADLWKLP